jgi:hypothetical protein
MYLCVKHGNCHAPSAKNGEQACDLAYLVFSVVLYQCVFSTGWKFIIVFDLFKKEFEPRSINYVLFIYH